MGNNSTNPKQNADDRLRHRVLEAFTRTANQPPRTFIPGTATSQETKQWLVGLEVRMGDHRSEITWSECALCMELCGYKIEILHGEDSLLANGIYRTWREIQSFLKRQKDSPLEYDLDEIVFQFLDGPPNDIREPFAGRARTPLTVEWLKANFLNVVPHAKRHIVPMLFRVSCQPSLWAEWKQPSSEAYVWYTATGVASRNLSVAACLPTLEAAESWRADHLGIASVDEITWERIYNNLTFRA